MQRERTIPVLSLKVKRLVKLFEVSKSPRKSMASKKDKAARKEKAGRIRNALAGELSSDGEATGQQQSQEQVIRQPVVPQPGTSQQPAVSPPGGNGQQQEQLGTVENLASKAGGSMDIMRNFLNRGEESNKKVTGTPGKRNREEEAPKEPPAKRQEGEEGESEGSIMEVENRAGGKGSDNTAEDEIRRIMERCKNGEMSLDEACHGMMSFVNRRLEDQLNKIRKAVVAVVQEQQERDKAARSLVIFNADKWQIPEQGDGLGVQPLMDRITGAIHRMTGHMVSVMEVIPMGPRREGKEPSMVKVILGSARQKSTFFRCLAAHTRNGTRIGQELAKISVRDFFPREKVNDAKTLIQRGAVLKRNGKIASYRVLAKGEGCIPVLEVKHYSGGGQKGPWVVFQSQMGQGTGDGRLSRSPRRDSRSGERRQREKGTDRGEGSRNNSGPPVWELDMEAVFQLPWDQASAMMEKEKERLRVGTAAWKKRRDQELEWNTYVEPY